MVDSEDEYDSESRSGSKKKDQFPASKRQLFLVEFLVDTATIDPTGIDEEILEAQTCLTLKFLNFPPMDICEKDFDPNREHGVDKIRFNSGKSLMFAFSEDQCENPPPISVEITVYKRLNGDKINVGSIKVCMAEIFRQTYDIAKYTPDRLPASKSIKDCFMLIGHGKRTTGEVGIYIRLSCLGQNVVTEFQCGTDIKTDPILFKNREGKKVFEFTGNDVNLEADDDRRTMFKEGCGCIEQASKRGGQEDAKRGTSGIYTRGNKVVVDAPNKSNCCCCGGHNVDRYKVTNANENFQVKQNSLFDSHRTADGLAVSQLNANPDQNCFILRVGDKGQIPDRGKMILEFRTPKQKILPKVIPPYHEDVAVQTDTGKKPKPKK